VETTAVLVAQRIKFGGLAQVKHKWVCFSDLK